MGHLKWHRMFHPNALIGWVELASQRSLLQRSTSATPKSARFMRAPAISSFSPLLRTSARLMTDSTCFHRVLSCLGGSRNRLTKREVKKGCYSSRVCVIEEQSL